MHTNIKTTRLFLWVETAISMNFCTLSNMLRVQEGFYMRHTQSISPHSPPPEFCPTEKKNKALVECAVQKSEYLSQTSSKCLTLPFPPPPIPLICLGLWLTGVCGAAVSHLRNVSDTCHLFYQVASHLEHSVSQPRLNVCEIQSDQVSGSSDDKQIVAVWRTRRLKERRSMKHEECSRTEQNLTVLKLQLLQTFIWKNIIM